MGLATPKQYLTLGDKTMLQHSLDAISADSRVAGIMVAISAQDEYWQDPQINIPVYTAQGGDERCDSVLNALHALANYADDTDWVLVHDAARPCLRSEDLTLLIDQLIDDPVGGILALPVRDTIKQSGKQSDTGHQHIDRTIDRSRLWHALTPQMFPYGLLKAALQKAMDADVVITDDASAMEFCGYQPQLVCGHGDNLKITRNEDLELAIYYLQQQGRV